MPGSPVTHYVNQAVFELTENCLPPPPKGTGHRCLKAKGTVGVTTANAFLLHIRKEML